MAEGLDIRKEVAFLVGVALDSVDPRTVIHALEYRHNGKVDSRLLAEIRREFSHTSEHLPAIVEVLPPTYLHNNTD